MKFLRFFPKDLRTLSGLDPLFKVISAGRVLPEIIRNSDFRGFQAAPWRVERGGKINVFVLTKDGIYLENVMHDLLRNAENTDFEILMNE